MPKSEKTYALQLTRSEIRALDAAGGMFDEIVEEYVRDGELPEGVGEGWSSAMRKLHALAKRVKATG